MIQSNRAIKSWRWLGSMRFTPHRVSRLCLGRSLCLDCFRVKALILSVIALTLAAGCGGSSSSSPVDAAISQANDATCNLATAYTFTAIDKLHANFVSGYGVASAVKRAPGVLRSARFQATQSCTSAAQRTRLRHDVVLITCDLNVAAQGRYCPGQT